MPRYIRDRATINGINEVTITAKVRAQTLRVCQKMMTVIAK